MSSELIFTPKQQELLSLFKHDKLHRLNLLEGSVRSGKTWISIVLWAVWIASRPKNYLYLMTGKSLQTLKRNCLLPLQELVGENNFTFSLAAIESIKKEYQGVFYERFILGNWVSAEGCIYTVFANNKSRFIIKEPPKDIMLTTIGFDFGNNGSAHAGCCTGITKGYNEVITLDEYYRKEVISPEVLINDICDFIVKVQRKYRCFDAYFDNAETTLIQGVKLAVQRRKIPVNIRNAKKGAINDRIRLYQMLQGTERYKIMAHCKNTIEAFSTAVWAPKNADERLDDGSINIDNLDAQEYSTEPFMQQLMEAGRNYL